MSPYGELLSDFIKRKSLQQKQFAEKIGVLPNHVSQVINGTKGPFAAQHDRIVDVLKLTHGEANELLKLSEFSNRTFRLSDEANPIHYKIAALLSNKTTADIDKMVEIARLALIDYEANASYR